MGNIRVYKTILDNGCEVIARKQHRERDYVYTVHIINPYSTLERFELLNINIKNIDDFKKEANRIFELVGVYWWKL